MWVQAMRDNIDFSELMSKGEDLRSSAKCSTTKIKVEEDYFCR